MAASPTPTPAPRSTSPTSPRMRSGSIAPLNVGGAPLSGTVRHYNSFSQTVDQLTGVGADDFWNQNVDFFVEDQWKATPKLLLSLGLRYDVQLVPGPDMPYSQAVSPVAYNATSQINPDLHMIQPRFGFNFNPMIPAQWSAADTVSSTARSRTRPTTPSGVKTASTRSSTAPLPPPPRTFPTSPRGATISGVGRRPPQFALRSLPLPSATATMVLTRPTLP